MELIYEILFVWGWDLVWMPSAHFLSSGLLAMFVYWVASRRPEIVPTKYALWLAIAFAVLLHVIEDYTVNIF